MEVYALNRGTSAKCLECVCVHTDSHYYKMSLFYFFSCCLFVVVVVVVVAVIVTIIVVIAVVVIVVFSMHDPLNRTLLDILWKIVFPIEMKRTRICTKRFEVVRLHVDGSTSFSFVKCLA